jgi:hypothetical protein
MKLTILGSLFAALVGFSVQGHAFPDKKVPYSVNLLGQTEILKKADTDTINVKSCASMGLKVSHIKLRALKSPVDVYGVRVTFGNGTKMSLPVNYAYYKGSESQWVSLGGYRCVHSITISANGKGGKSIVQFFGVTSPNF